MAASAMYKMKPFYGDSDVVVAYPTCMYKMKNLHVNSADDVEINDYPELLELIHHQEAVLHELEKLRREVDQIGFDIGMNSQSDVTSAVSTGNKQHLQPPSDENVPCNIVVKACPDNPPLSAYLLYRLAQQQGLDCSIMSHVHSTWTGQIPNELSDLFNPCQMNCSKCLRFIWKSDILAPSLMVSVVEQSPILSETNILRYLSRLFLPLLYSNNQPLHITYIDNWLNAASKSLSAKDGKLFMQNLNSHLGQNNWLVDNAPSIADIHCSVTLLKSNCGGQFPKNVSKWMTECRKEFPGFDQVEKLCK